MNAEEAIKIIKSQEHQLGEERPKRFNTQTIQQEYLYIEAKAYLSALEGPEVRALVEALEIINEIIETNYEEERERIGRDAGHIRSMAMGAAEALQVVKSGIDDISKPILAKFRDRSRPTGAVKETK